MALQGVEVHHYSLAPLGPLLWFEFVWFQGGLRVRFDCGSLGKDLYLLHHIISGVIIKLSRVRVRDVNVSLLSPAPEGEGTEGASQVWANDR